MGTSKLKIERVKSNLTQEELAKIIGVTRQTIGLIEKGKYNPSLSLCLQICYTLNKSLDEIFWAEKENDKGDFK
ncbi:helix-turn-helix transcriptional regulator (plasmid) [Bacillus albus]|uniref:HTH cro/C1-type domain-containing protein n=2 Tax=Bacillus cereus group TaxID=86661 RepID=A0A1C4F753_BACTU|nr:MULTISPECIES: helix-turn-helix transcriptional regulator [Bacillus]MCU5114943.1 helix-turn-helix transcriptional regulator [Bacillus wiedmannii]MCU5150313.1 helix-turn-helix transcriptional regulator [Bacillus wiedmannii]MCU5410669.1 helix-turn-helix transcriptional regulator [Bacillus wiedmannii]MDA2029883.1 helix-turn-helix transcriptional regulator [Bacillus cereus group sp. Bcc03]MDA2219796.1 helix-turn-helix transcriptional regulator [Bacillus cereus group sp. Bc228]